MAQANVMRSRSTDQTLALARQHAEAGRFSAAAALCNALLRARPDWPPALHMLGFVALKSNDFTTAAKMLRRTLQYDEKNAQCYSDLGVIYRNMGNIESARLEFERAIELNADSALYHYNLSTVVKYKENDVYIPMMKRLESKITSRSLLDQTYLHFALAKAYQDLGRHDDAFRHLEQGNTLKRSQVAYDEAAWLQMHTRIRTVLTADFIAERQGAGYPSSVPIFVTGMPRSGTSLVEQILASHPAVYGAGELADFGKHAEAMTAGRDGQPGYPENVPLLSPAQLDRLGRTYVSGIRRRAHGALRIVDKGMGQYLFIGLIRLALPEARIVHVKRNPVDACFSCYATLFEEGQDFTYDLGELGRAYRARDALMDHWRASLPPDRFLDIQYEDIVSDLEAEARRLLAFCGLEWDPRCLAFHETRRPVLTASAAQVRQPIYASARGRAAVYRDHLGPLIAALGDLAPT